MFTEELKSIKDAEDRAEALKKEARLEAKKMIENANTEAGIILAEAEEKSRDMISGYAAEGQEAASAEHDRIIAEAEEICKKLEADAGKKQDQIVRFISERIVKASVNN